MWTNLERWQQLCALAAAEQDPQKLLALIQEINEAKGCLRNRRQIFYFGDQFVSCHKKQAATIPSPRCRHKPAGFHYETQQPVLLSATAK